MVFNFLHWMVLTFLIVCSKSFKVQKNLMSLSLSKDNEYFVFSQERQFKEERIERENRKKDLNEEFDWKNGLVNKEKQNNRQAKKDELEGINFQRQNKKEKIERIKLKLKTKNEKIKGFKSAQNRQQTRQESISQNEDQNYRILKQNKRYLQTATPVQLIKNGDFSINTCTFVFCVYTTTNFKSSYIDYWQPDPEIEIGYASFYILNAGKYRVTELTGTKGTCLKQWVRNVPKGIYTLTYIYGAKAALLLSMAQIYVYLNSTLIDQRTATNHNWNKVTVGGIRISQNNTSFYFKMCGNMSTSLFGVAISNVSLKFTSSIQEVNATTANKTTTTNNSATQTNNTSSSTAFQKMNSFSTLFPFNTNPTQTNTNGSSSTNGTSSSTNGTSSSTNGSSSTNRSSVQNGSSSANSLSVPGNDLVLTPPIIQANPSTPNASSQISIISPDNSSSSEESVMTENSGIQEYTDSGIYQNELPMFNQVKNILLPSDPTSIFYKTPAVRTIVSGAGSVFINLDHLWFYIYHQRNYSIYLTQIFMQVHEFETTKWNTAEQEIRHYITDVDRVEVLLDHKSQYTKFYFAFLQHKSGQFLANIYKFFIVNVPLVFIVFFILRIAHKFFTLCGLNNFFKDFSFNYSFIITLLDGNSQSFVYFLLFDITTLFAKDPTMRIINISSLLIAFVLVMLLLAGPFVLKYLQRNHKDKLFYTNCKDNLQGALFFMVQFGLFNILLGSTHVLSQNYLNLQLVLLLLIQMSFIGFILTYLAWYKRIFESKFKVVLIMMFSFLRVNLIGSIYFFTQFPNFRRIVQYHQQICVILYLSLFALSFIYCVVMILVSSFKDIYIKVKSKPKKAGKQRERNIKQAKTTRFFRNGKVAPIMSFCDSEFFNINDLKVEKIKEIRVKRQKKIQCKTQIHEVIIKTHKNTELKNPKRMMIDVRSKSQKKRSLGQSFRNKHGISKTLM